MPVKEKCYGCHGAREAIAAAEAVIGAEEQIRTCEAAADLLSPLAARLQQALDRLRQVPQDLGEAYELVYQFIRKAGNCRLWPAGSKARGPGGEREPGGLHHPAGRGLCRGDRPSDRLVGELAARAEPGLQPGAKGKAAATRPARQVAGTHLDAIGRSPLFPVKETNYGHIRDERPWSAPMGRALLRSSGVFSQGS